MKNTTLNVRISIEDRLELEKYIKEKTEFENVSTYVRILIKRELKKIKEGNKQ